MELCAALFDKEPRNVWRGYDRVVQEQQSARQTRSQVWFRFCERLCIKKFDGRPPLLIEALLPIDLGHLYFIGSDPDGAARKILGARRQTFGQFFPEELRITCKGELGFGI